jgi:NTE family protein
MNLNWIKRNRKIGLALGGGAALGGAHIGILKAFDELGLKISYISGNSIGSIVGALYAFGKSWQEIEEIATDMNWLDISNFSISKYGLFNNKKLGDKITESIGDLEFKDAGIPLSIVASNLNTGKKIILKEGSVSKAVMASAAIPGIFRPVEMDGKLLVDGGIVENVPVSLLQKTSADIIIGVNLNARRSFKKPESWFGVLINSYYTLVDSLAKASASEADLMIEPDLSKFSLVDTKNTKALAEKGYEEALKVLKEYFF